METDFQIFRHALTYAVADWRLSLGEPSLEKLWQHFGAVVQANRAFNLTRITDPREAALKHYADSLALLAWSRVRGIELATVLDVGTGAGFPAIPIAIMQPNTNVTALESTAKKARFVERIARILALDNLRVVHAHSTHWKALVPFCVVTGRAVASLARCVHNFGEFVQQGGYCVLYKSAVLKAEEISEGIASAKRMGFYQCQPFFYEFSCVAGSFQSADSTVESTPVTGERAGQTSSQIPPLPALPLKRQLVVFQRS